MRRLVLHLFLQFHPEDILLPLPMPAPTASSSPYDPQLSPAALEDGAGGQGADPLGPAAGGSGEDQRRRGAVPLGCSPEQGAERVLALGAKLVMVTLGPKGCFLKNAQAEYRCGCPQVRTVTRPARAIFSAGARYGSCCDMASRRKSWARVRCEISFPLPVLPRDFPRQGRAAFRASRSMTKSCGC